MAPHQCANHGFLSLRPQIAVRLLAHKIQSPQEWEAVQALTVGFSPQRQNSGLSSHTLQGPVALQKTGRRLLIGQAQVRGSTEHGNLRGREGKMSGLNQR